MNPDTETTSLLTKTDFENAVQSQNACNLAGIVYTLASIMPRIWNEARARGLGTKWVNEHPICALFAEQISHLSGCGMTNNEKYGTHINYCEAMAQGNRVKAAQLLPEYAPLQKEAVNG